MPVTDRMMRGFVVPIEFTADDFPDGTSTDRVSLTVIHEGYSSILLNGAVTSVSAPSVLCLGPNSLLSAEDAGGFKADTFYFHPQFLNSNLSFENLRDNTFSTHEDKHDRNLMGMFLNQDSNYVGVLNIPLSTYLRISEWFAIISNEITRHNDLYWTCRIRRYLLQILYLLDDFYMRLTDENADFKKELPDFVKEYIHLNYHETLSLDTLCRAADTNRTTLNREFKRNTGCTAMEYLLLYRLKIASEALIHTNLTISEIALATGFNYDTYFIKQFQAKNGLTPTKYRRSNPYWTERYREILEREGSNNSL